MTNQPPAILSPRIQLLHKAIQNADLSPLPEFWAEMAERGLPLIEEDGEDDSLVTFLWRDDGSAHNVAVIQDWGCDGIREHHMSHLPGSDVWFITRRMRSDTRTTYQLSPSSSPDPSEPAPYQLDPLNSKTYTVYPSETGYDIRFSLLELPKAPVLPWRQTGLIKESGSIQLHTPFTDQRRLWVYLPPIRTQTPLPLLVAFDGRLYKDLLHLPEIMDYLIGQKQVPPVAALLVDKLDRSELLCKPEFTDYMTNQVLPWLRSTYSITNDPRLTIVAGSSYGGLAAAFAGFKYPDIWGTVLSQTGWFRWHPEDHPEHHWLSRQFKDAPRLPLRFWLQVGNLEVARMLDGGPSQLAANQHLRDVLQSKGYLVSYHEYSGGHDASSLEFPLAKAIIEILQ